MTVYYTRKTTKAAIKATDAAVASAKTADDTFKITKLAMEASDRAYVHYESTRYTSHKSIVDGRIFWRFRVIWINKGDTPTRHVLTYSSLQLLDALLPPDFEFSIDPSVERVPTTISPQGTISSGGWDIFGSDLVDVQNGIKQLSIWGVATYRDTFPDTPPRVTKFFIHVGNIMGDPLLPWDEKSNKVEVSFLFKNQHNCQDEDCA